MYLLRYQNIVLQKSNEEKQNKVIVMDEAWKLGWSEKPYTKNRMVRKVPG